MKKMLAIIVGVAIAGGAVADISVDLFNSTGFLKAGFPSGSPSGESILPTGTLVQLIWKADNTGYQSDDLSLSLLNVGEVELFRGNANDDWGKFQLGSVLKGDADVGGDITAGYFYARIFDSVDGAAGSSFLEMGIEGTGVAGGLTTFASQDPTTGYSDSLNDLGAWVSLDAQGTTVIPEPATIGLMGIAGLGMFLARRKARR